MTAPLQLDGQLRFDFFCNVGRPDMYLVQVFFCMDLVPFVLYVFDSWSQTAFSLCTANKQKKKQRKKNKQTEIIMLNVLLKSRAKVLFFSLFSVVFMVYNRSRWWTVMVWSKPNLVKRKLNEATSYIILFLPSFPSTVRQKPRLRSETEAQKCETPSWC